MKTHFATALTDIINRDYAGNKKNFAAKCGVVYSTIHRFCADSINPTVEKLADICAILPMPERKELLLAAARDRVPTEYQKEIFGSSDQASDMIRASLPPDIAAVIRYLESTALNDHSTAEYLRRIGKWVGIIDSPLQQTAIAAEDEIRYGAK